MTDPKLIKKLLEACIRFRKHSQYILSELEAQEIQEVLSEITKHPEMDIYILAE